MLHGGLAGYKTTESLGTCAMGVGAAAAGAGASPPLPLLLSMSLSAQQPTTLAQQAMPGACLSEDTPMSDPFRHS